MRYEKILSNWINVREHSKIEYDFIVQNINTYLQFFYYSDNRRFKYDEYDAFINYIKYYYVKDNILYMFYYTGKVNILIKYVMSEEDFINCKSIKYLVVENEKHLDEIILNMGLYYKSNRDEKINHLLGIDNINYIFDDFNDFYRDHIIHYRNVNNDVAKDYLNNFIINNF
jgi:hypothetical protein